MKSPIPDQTARAPEGRRLEFVGGPRDGWLWKDAAPPPDGVALDKSPVVAPDGRPVLVRYVLAERVSAEDGQARDVMLFDGWYVRGDGDSYGPQLGRGMIRG